MNGQLPPIDPDLRQQLTRRSAGRLPEGLLAEVSAALDGVAPARAGARETRPIWRVPRLAVAGMGAVLVAVLAVAIALPALHSAPSRSLAGYPAARALTTAELASLMAGPALPTNTTLVASVTIESRQDVCPMNSRPTIGVIQGMGSQVCVIGSSVSEYLKQAAGTGTFAFRYVAPGYLGLIGEITPASSQLAFHVTDEWPIPTVKTFLAEGWLGATALQCDATQTFDIGDFLNPSGYEPCRSSWLSEDGSSAPVIENQAAASPAESGAAAASPAPSIDLLELHGKARYVTAGGARQLDGIPLETTRGVYVVRATIGPCPGASPVDSRGCAAWQILAKVADISVAAPTAAPTAKVTVTPITGYPADRALTTDELAALLAGPALPVDTAIVASVTIESRPDVCPMNRYPTVGVVQGMGSQVCVMGATLAAKLSGSFVQGVFAFRYLAPGYLGLLGEITPGPSKLAHRVADDWPLGGKTFLVQGWLGADAGTSNTVISCAINPGDDLYPNGGDCPTASWLSDVEAPTSVNRGPAGSPRGGTSLSGDARYVEAGGMRLIDSIDPEFPVFGVYVVRADTGACPYPSAVDVSGCATWRVLARVTDVPRPQPSARPTPTPTTALPATPVALPTGLPGTAPIGLIGSGNLPLTAGVFATLWAADPAHLAGRIVIVKGPVPTGFQCWDAGAADAAVPSPACHIAILDDQIAADGHYWVVQIGADGKLGVVGELSTPQNSFVFTLSQAIAAPIDAGSTTRTYLVDAWIRGIAADSCDVFPVPPSGPAPSIACHEASWLGSKDDDQRLEVQLGAYGQFGVGRTAGGPAIHALFLVQTKSGLSEVLARLEVATP